MNSMHAGARSAAAAAAAAARLSRAGAAPQAAAARRLTTARMGGPVPAAAAPPSVASLQQTAALRRLVGAGAPRRSSVAASETHDDFKPVPSADAGEDGDIQARIKEELDAHKVVLFMKGLPSAPACGFSYKVVSLLAGARVEYRAHNVLVDDALRSGIKAYSSWPTIPQLYVGGEFVGGSDIVEGMATSGELRQLLVDAGAYGEATPPPAPPAAA